MDTFSPGREFGQQVMELEHEADMVITEGGQFFAVSWSIRCSLSQIAPSSALSRVPRICNRVLLPAPEEPTILTISPG
jgi:hypothetical protein